MKNDKILETFVHQRDSFSKFVTAEERLRRGQPGKWTIKPSDLSSAKALEFTKKLIECRYFADLPKLVAVDLPGAMALRDVAEQITEAEIDSGYESAAGEHNYRLLAEVTYGAIMRES
jgi:hypothetical protein